MIFEIDSVLQSKKQSILDTIKAHNLTPTLLIVSANDDFASSKYINNKVKFAKEMGVEAAVLKTTYNTTTEALIKDIKTVFETYNVKNKKVDGVIVQLPINPNINLHLLNQTIDQYNCYGDVDGFGVSSVAGLYYNDVDYNNGFVNVPCTAQGVFDIVNDFYNQNVSGKSIVIINRSNIVGKPLALLCLHNNMTVTIAHSKTTKQDLYDAISKADVVVTAVGIKQFINNKDFKFKKGGLIVDVSINRNQDGKVCGDVDKVLYDSEEVYCTKVPGGVGKLTVANLISNIVNSAVKTKETLK